MTIVYSFLVLDLPHRGHIQHLQMAQELGDFLIVGVLDGDTVEGYKRRPVMLLEERMKMASRIKGVDMVIPQFEKFPLENLRLLHKMFPSDRLICVHGSDWKKEEFKQIIDYLKSIGGELRLLPYYHPQSTTSIIRAIKEKG